MRWYPNVRSERGNRSHASFYSFTILWSRQSVNQSKHNRTCLTTQERHGIADNHLLHHTPPPFHCARFGRPHRRSLHRQNRRRWLRLHLPCPHDHRRPITQHPIHDDELQHRSGRERVCVRQDLRNVQDVRPDAVRCTCC